MHYLFSKFGTGTEFRFYLQISNQQILKQWNGYENGKRQRRTSQALLLHNKSKRLQPLPLQLCPLCVVVSLSRKRWNLFSWNKNPVQAKSHIRPLELHSSSRALWPAFTPSFLHSDLWVRRSTTTLHQPPSHPSLLNASSLFSKLNIVLHRSNPQTRHRLCLQGFPCSFSQGLAYDPPTPHQQSGGRLSAGGQEDNMKR